MCMNNLFNYNFCTCDQSKTSKKKKFLYLLIGLYYSLYLMTLKASSFAKFLLLY